MAVVEVTFSPLPAHVRTARLVAIALARRVGLDESTLDEVRLAVGEACSRAVGLHQQFAPAAPVVVEIELTDHRLTVTVTDVAPADRTDMRLDDMRLDDTRLDDMRLDDMRLDDTRLDDMRLDDTRLDDTRLDDMRLDDTRLDDMRLDDMRLDDMRLDDMRLDDMDAQAGAVPAGRPGEPFSESLPPGFGLAVIDGLVDALDVGTAPDGTGSRVRMSWPVSGPAPSPEIAG